ncbi:hypothetical protein HPB51_007206 [Rhipicephalus microplus]|uniref:Uncharacterized protein n=1 Tax=Rhipicephalus microplus TaxID=6941 RepID=A0A9J6E0V8_RHIMP|nr:hypothetical protein HPB51_007206 [Rhipicephalus microplus]
MLRRPKKLRRALWSTVGCLWESLKPYRSPRGPSVSSLVEGFPTADCVVSAAFRNVRDVVIWWVTAWPLGSRSLTGRESSTVIRGCPTLSRDLWLTWVSLGAFIHRGVVAPGLDATSAPSPALCSFAFPVTGKRLPEVCLDGTAVGAWTEQPAGLSSCHGPSREWVSRT